MLELLQNISGLDEASSLLEEVIIVNNCSTSDYGPVLDYIRTHPEMPFRYFDAPSNLGVAGGRNFALAKGKASIAIMVDDDAVLENKDCLVNLVKEFDSLAGQRRKAIVSFRVLYYENRQMQQNALPHKQFQAFKDKAFFETYYYAGGAHAVRREVMEKLGDYPADFFYGMEEYDLSYRILDAGYAIVYSDKITMLHKESPLGRKPKEEKLRMMWVNKATVAYRYLPRRYFYSTALMWSLQYLRIAGINLRGYMIGWKAVWAIPHKQPRTPLRADTLQYIRSLKARLWY